MRPGRAKQTCSALLLLVLAVLLAPNVYVRARVGQWPDSAVEAPKHQRALAASEAVFLPELPLEVVSTVPAELLGAEAGATAELEGSDALQVIFSRPVIALGADFSDADSPVRQPFSLTDQTGRDWARTGFRWVSTNIARVDARNGWPSDLQLQLTWNNTLTSWDGARLKTEGLGEGLRFVTKPLAMDLDSVTSELASNATGGLWYSKWKQGGDEPMHEVPPDGVIKLSLRGSKVNRTVLASAMFLTDLTTKANWTKRVELVECSGQSHIEPIMSEPSADSSNWVCLQCIGLVPGRTYSLTLPTGTRYNAHAGALPRPLSVSFASLQPFTIPVTNVGWQLATSRSEASYTGITSRRLELLMPHGLQDEASVSGLLGRLTVREVPAPWSPANATMFSDLPISIKRTGKATVQIRVALLPARKYELVVHPAASNTSSVLSSALLGAQPLRTRKDGKPDVYTFTTKDAENVFEVPTGPGGLSGSCFLDAQAANSSGSGSLLIPIVSRAPHGGWYQWALSAVPVFPSAHQNSAQSKPYLLREYLSEQLLGYRYPPPLLKDRLGLVNISQASLGGASGITPVSAELDLKATLDPTGMALLQMESVDQQGYRSVYSNIVMVSDVAVAITMVGGKTIVVYATNVATGAPERGVQVHLHANRAGWSSEAIETGERGTAKLTLGDNSEYPWKTANGLRSTAFAAELTTPRGQTMLADLPSFGTDTALATLVASVYFDRRVVAPGHTLHVYGVARKLTQGDTQTITQPVTAALCSSTCLSDPIPVAIDPTFGSFSLAINLTDQIVATLGYADVTLSLQSCPQSGACASYAQSNFGSATFTISDPRPPTATLELKSPAWTPTDGNVTVSGSVTSLIGADIADSTVDIAWNLLLDYSHVCSSGTAPPNECPPTEGTLKAVSGADGAFSAKLDLGETLQSFGNVSNADLTFKATWIGPTRERITATASTRVSRSRVEITVSTPVGEVIPKQDFPITVSVVGLPDADVKVYAAPLTEQDCDTRFVCGSPGITALAPEQQSHLLTNATPVCATRAGDSSWESCRWALPSVGHFAIVACAAAQGGAEVAACGAVFRGRTAAQWEENRVGTVALTEWQFALPEGQAEWRVGDTAVVQVENPVDGASVLLVWASNSESAEVLVERAPRGLARVAFNVSEGCLTGCTVTVLLSWPRLTDNPLTADVPTMPFLDPLAPAIVTSGYPRQLPVHVPRDSVPPTVSLVRSSGVEDTSLATRQPSRDEQDASEPMVLEPGEQAVFTVNVTFCADSAVGNLTCGAGSPDHNTQVVLVAVDKTWLLLKDNPAPDMSSVLDADWAPAMSTVTTLESMLYPKAMRLWQERNMGLLSEDPWLPPITIDSLQQSDQEYLAMYQAQLWSGYYDSAWAYSSAVDDSSGGVVFSASATLDTSAPGAASPGFAIAASESSVPRSGAVAKADGSMGSPVAPESGSVRVETAAAATPLYHVATLRAGESQLSVPFTAPSKLSTYVVRAFTTSSSLTAFGASEMEVIVRRALSLTPSVPRFVRNGDTFTAGVIVTLANAPRDAPFTVSVRLDAGGDVTVRDASSQQLHFAVGAVTAEARFNLSAAAEGAMDLVFTASQAPHGDDLRGTYRDALSVPIEVLPRQAPVRLATSFAIEGGGNGNTEGLELPAAEPGSGTVQLTAGVGNLPSQLSILALEADAAQEPKATSAPWTIAAWVIATALQQYDSLARVNSTVSHASALQLGGSAQQRASLPTCDVLLATIAHASSVLPSLSDDRVGLMFWPANAWPGWTRPKLTDVELNLQATLQLALSETYVESVGASMSNPQNRTWPPRSPCAPYANRTRPEPGDLGSRWVVAAEVQLIKDALASAVRFPNRETCYVSTRDALRLWLIKVAWSHTTSNWNLTGAFDTHWYACKPLPAMDDAQAACGGGAGKATARATVGRDLSMQGLVRAADDMTLEESALFALVLQRAEGVDAAIPAAVGTRESMLTRLHDSMRITGRSAYAAASESTARPASACTQAHIMLAQLAADPSSPLVHKHAVYLASAFGSAYGYDAFAAACVATALAAYDLAHASANPSLALEARSGAVTLLSAGFEPDSPPVVTSETLWSELAEPPEPITFEADGSGTASVAALLVFVPAALPSSPTYNGIFVDLALRAVDPLTGAPTGAPVTFAPLAATLHCTVQVTTPDRLGPATVRVLLPGGLEPIDPNLDNDASSGCIQPWWLQGVADNAAASVHDLRVAGPAVSVPWWGVCPRVETKPDAVTFHLDSGLESGTHTFDFQAVAATPGAWTLPPASASVESEPEVMGLSAGAHFTVCATRQCSLEELAAHAQEQGRALEPPIGCADNCNGVGTCDLGTGVCRCNPNWHGRACTKYGVTS